MARVICYADSAGRLCIVVPAPTTRRRGETVAEFVARIAAKDAPPGAVIVDDASIPADRKFRSAWALSGDVIVHDMAKARALHLRNIRAKRNAALRATDALVLKATDTGDAVALSDLRALRQRLRDIPADIASEIDAAVDVGALEKITSTALSDADAIIGDVAVIAVSRA